MHSPAHPYRHPFLDMMMSSLDTPAAPAGLTAAVQALVKVLEEYKNKFVWVFMALETRTEPSDMKLQLIMPGMSRHHDTQSC